MCESNTSRPHVIQAHGSKLGTDGNTTTDTAASTRQTPVATSANDAVRDRPPGGGEDSGAGAEAAARAAGPSMVAWPAAGSRAVIEGETLASGAEAQYAARRARPSA
jgi:hypothetical protein